jgi:putative acetyltransferase
MSYVLWLFNRFVYRFNRWESSFSYLAFMPSTKDYRFSIRRLGNADSGAVAGLVLPIQQLEFGVAITLEAQPDILDIERSFNRDRSGLWGAFIDEQLVGTIGLIDIGAGAGVVRKMFVHASYRGKQWGIAQLLMDTLVGHCRNAGIKDLWLGTIHTMGAAARFYERNGFIKISKEGLPGSFPLMAVDDTFYHLVV